MDIRRKWLVVLAIFLLLISMVAAAIVLQFYLSTKVKLILPHDIRAEPMTWDWGNLSMRFGPDTVNTTQKVTFTNYGAKPLTLSAVIDFSTVSPAWYLLYCYSLDWTAEGYEIQPLESLETTFTLIIDVPVAREYMITNQIMEVDVTFDILVSVSDIPLPHYNLTIETTANGTTDPAPGTYSYVEGKIVTVTGIPDSGYTLMNWVLDGANYTENPIDVSMYANHSLTAYFKEAVAKLYIDPEHNNFAVGETFTITVAVADIENLYIWQIQIFFDPTLLNCTGAWYPLGHVFDGKPMVPVTPVIDNDVGSVLHGATLMGVDFFTGSGTLCQIEFEVLGIGSCGLNFSEPYGADTFLWDVDMTDIPADVINGYFDNT